VSHDGPDQKRNGTTTLLAALDVPTSTMGGLCFCEINN